MKYRFLQNDTGFKYFSHPQLPLMKIPLHPVFFCLLVLLTLSSAKAQTQARPPAVEKEFRAAWIATVANINWPSKPGLSTAEQQKEVIAQLDFLKAHHFNAVIFQVRPMADALYDSKLEPWSYYLTGEQGKAPDPYYDPLQFWTEAAHDRGLEMHVWLNPYRAYHPTSKNISDGSIVKTNPELVVKLKQNYYWMDPARKETQDKTAAVVRDLVKRYDIDGVHLDDYFYPYPEYNGGEDFPDQESWAAYQQKGGTLSRGDWRRAAVNTLIERLYKEIKAEKKYVKFGISPFGTWRPGYPSIVEGFDQYNTLYADARLWLNKGWVDYFTPQLYWPINRIPLSFPILLGWWEKENTKKRHLWPGMSVGDSSIKGTNETLSQIMITRGMLPNSAGAVHWSLSSVIRSSNLSKALLDGPYKKEALVPASPWLGNKQPEAPTVQTSKSTDGIQVSFTHPHADKVFRWVVYQQYGNSWTYQVLNRNEHGVTIAASLKDKNNRDISLVKIAVTAVDRLGNESERIETEITQ